MTTSPVRLSGARTFVLWGLAVVWFSEMMLSGVRPLTEWWTQFWEYRAPGDPRLFLVYGIMAAAKGTLGVLAVQALRSRSPLVRTALFVPMAIVPPLNVAFPFRIQGFLLRPTLIGTALSVLLWQTFLLFKDGPESSDQAPSSTGASSLSLRDAARYAWFAINALALTLAGALFLFAPDVGIRLAFPCLSVAGEGVPRGLMLAGLVAGTHLTAVATATWIGTAFSRRNPQVRQAVAAANTLHATLLLALPLAQLAVRAGTACASSSLLVYTIPQFAGWLIYGVLTSRSRAIERVRLRQYAGH